MRDLSKYDWVEIENALEDLLYNFQQEFPFCVNLIGALQRVIAELPPIEEDN